MDAKREDKGQRGWVKRLLPPLLILLVGVLAYWNSFDGVFLYDDIGSIRDNVHIRKLWPLSEAMSVPLWSSATTVDGRPLLSLTFALNYHFGRLDPWGYHLVNVIIHIMAGLLLFGVVRRTFELPQFRDRYIRGGTWVSLATALIWLVHPLQTESVTYIVQRAESLMGMLYLLTLYAASRGFGEGMRDAGCVVRGKGETKNAAARWHIVAVAACAIGMAVKQTMFSAPLLVLLYDGLFVSDSIGKAFVKRKRFYVALFATWAIVFGIIIATWKESTMDFVTINPVRYLLTQPLVLLTYLRLAVWPSPLVLSYGWTLEDQWPRIVFPGLAIVGMLAVMFRGIWQRRWYGFVLAWFFLILAPTSSISPTRQAIFEHRLYLSLAAVVVLAVLSGDRALRSLLSGTELRPIVAVGLVAVVAVVLAFLTYDRNQDYHSEVGIWRDNLVHRPQSRIALNNLGNALTKLGRHHEAIARYHRALSLDPTYPQAHYNLGNALKANGAPKEAVASYRRALELKPDFADAWNNLGSALHETGDREQAIQQYRQALRVNPRHASAHFNLGQALQEAGLSQEAMAHYLQAVQSDPDMTDAQYNLGNALQAFGRFQDAIRHYQEVLRVEKNHTKAHNNLGNALLALARPNEAIPHYREALRSDPGQAEVHYNLGRTVVALGRVEEAIAHYQEALRLRPDFADAHYNLGNALVKLGRIEEAIAHYQQAVRINPGHAGAHSNLGSLYRDNGRLAEAVLHFEQAAKAMPDNEVLHKVLAETREMVRGAEPEG